MNLAYLALVSSTLIRPVLWLRSLLTVGAICFVIYGVLADIPSMYIWNTLIAILHIRQLIKLTRARKSVQLNSEQESFRLKWFPELSAYDFYSIWSMGTYEELTNPMLALEGQQQQNLYLLLDGEVRIQHGQTQRAVLGSGSLIGDASYLSGDGALANADAFGKGDIRVHRWDQMQLATLDNLNPIAGKAMHQFIGQNISQKML